MVEGIKGQTVPPLPFVQRLLELKNVKTYQYSWTSWAATNPQLDWAAVECGTHAPASKYGLVTGKKTLSNKIKQNNQKDFGA